MNRTLCEGFTAHNNGQANKPTCPIAISWKILYLISSDLSSFFIVVITTFKLLFRVQDCPEGLGAIRESCVSAFIENEE